jgi:zinc protease
LAQSAFGDWTPAGSAATPTASPAGQTVAPRVIVIDQPGAGQAAVAVAMRSVPRATADYFPLTLGNTLLGGSFTSRLNQEIRIKRGLSYGTRSSLGVRRDAGAFVASAQTRNDAAPEVVDLILAEVARLGSTAPTESPDRRLQRLSGDGGRAWGTGRRTGAVRPADERAGGLC